MKIPPDAPSVTLFNTRIPRQWYDHLQPIAASRNMKVSTLIKQAVRSQATQVEEQRKAVEGNMTVNAVRQRLLYQKYPDLPEWDFPVSRLRGNTPTDLVNKAEAEADEDKAHPRFSLTIPLSQAVYYGIKRMAAERGVEPEQFARKLINHAYSFIVDAKDS